MIITHPVPVTPPITPVKRGYHWECPICQLAVAYCKGHAPPDAPSKDGAESSLSRRIVEAQQQAGGT